MKLLSQEQLESHIEEIQEWYEKEKDELYKDNLKKNIRYFERSLAYYLKGLKDGKPPYKKNNLSSEVNK